MEISVSSRHVEITPSLKQAAIEKVGRLERYLEGMDRAEVHFSEERNPRITDREVCEVVLEGHGHHVRCKVAAHDGFAAIDKAVDKLEHQLHKLKTKLVRRHHGGVKNGSRNGRAEGAQAVREVDEDIVVKTKQFVMSPMSPADAAFQMELLGHGFFLFANSVTGRSAVVYRRDDGSVGLIEEAVEE